jgi:transposase
MNRRMPRVVEAADKLKARMGEERHALKRQRLHALYLVASGQARTRRAVAELLGLSRNTVGEWLAVYEQGGLSALLEVRTAPGRRATLSDAQEARLRQALAEPAGFASYQAVRDWIAQELQVEMKYDTVHKLVRYKLGAKLKVPRRTHIKKP